MRSILRPRVASLALLPALLLVSACGNSGGYPPLADLKAVVEEKPVPGDEIATDPVAEAHYNAAVESHRDRIWSAGARLCRFFAEVDMPGVDFCPAP
jgi:hypothetical protein